MQKFYNYKKSEKDYQYYFETKNAILYRVAFLEDNTFNAVTESNKYDCIYQIVIEKLNKTIEPLDTTVSETVMEIIFNFLSGNPYFIIYFCSNQDNKEFTRHSSFNRWYEKSDKRSIIGKSDSIMNIEGNIIYSALIFHQQNPIKNEILDIYNQIERELNSPK